MNNNKNQETMILTFLEKHAPSMPVDKALWLAREFQKVWDEGVFDAECLAVLSETIIGLDGSGHLPEHLKTGQRPAVVHALRQVSFRHGWTVCGPVANGMERLLEKFDKLAQEPR